MIFQYNITFHKRQRNIMLLLFFFVFLPCVLANKTQFVVDIVQAAPTDVEVRLETQAPSKMTCSALCKDYVAFTFTTDASTCQCFSEVSDQFEQDVSGTSGIYFGRKVVEILLYILRTFSHSQG